MSRVVPSDGRLSSRRDVLKTGLAIGAGMFTPWSWSRAEDKTAPSSTSKLNGRLFAFTFADFAPPGAEGIIAIDPESGQWQRVLAEPAPSGRISPDGRSLATFRLRALQEESNRGVWLFDLEGNEPKRVFQGLGAGQTYWSGDGTRLLACGIELPRVEPIALQSWVIPLDGQEPTKLDNLDGKYVLDWSADGKRVLFTELDAFDLRLLDLEGGEPRTLYKEEGHRIGAARFLLDGKQAVFESIKPGVGRKPENTVWWVDLSGDTPIAPRKRIEGGDRRLITSIVPSPDGKHLATTSIEYDPEMAGLPAPGEVANTLTIVDHEGKNPRAIPHPMRQLTLIDWR